MWVIKDKQNYGKVHDKEKSFIGINIRIRFNYWHWIFGCKLPYTM